MLSFNVHSTVLLMDCMAWWFWTMRQPNGCSTPVPRSSAAKQWLEQLAQKKWVNAQYCHPVSQWYIYIYMYNYLFCIYMVFWLALYNYNGLVVPRLSFYIVWFHLARYSARSGCVPCSSSTQRAPGKKATVSIYKILVRPAAKSRTLDLPTPKWTHLPRDHGLVSVIYEDADQKGKHVSINSILLGSNKHHYIEILKVALKILIGSWAYFDVDSVSCSNLELWLLLRPIMQTPAGVHSGVKRNFCLIIVCQIFCFLD